MPGAREPGEGALRLLVAPGEAPGRPAGGRCRAQGLSSAAPCPPGSPRAPAIAARRRRSRSSGALSRPIGAAESRTSVPPRLAQPLNGPRALRGEDRDAKYRLGKCVFLAASAETVNAVNERVFGKTSPVRFVK